MEMYICAWAAAVRPSMACISPNWVPAINNDIIICNAVCEEDEAIGEVPSPSGSCSNMHQHVSDLDSSRADEPMPPEQRHPNQHVGPRTQSANTLVDLVVNPQQLTPSSNAPRTNNEPEVRLAVMRLQAEVQVASLIKASIHTGCGHYQTTFSGGSTEFCSGVNLVFFLWNR